MPAPGWFMAAQNNPEAKHALDEITGDCEHVKRLRSVRSDLSASLIAQLQGTGKWRFLKRAKLEGGIDALDELTDRLNR